MTFKINKKCSRIWRSYRLLHLPALNFKFLSSSSSSAQQICLSEKRRRGNAQVKWTKWMTAEVHVAASVSGYWYCAGCLAITLSWLIATLIAIVSHTCANYLAWPGLFQVTTVEERSRGSSTTCRRLGLLGRPPGSTHFAYIIICTRYCVNATCKLRCCCSVLYMQE